MKKKILARTLAVAMVATTLFTVTACGAKDTILDETKISNTETSNTESSETETSNTESSETETSSTESSETETSSTEDTNVDTSNGNFMTTEGYQSLEDIIEDSEFEELRWTKDQTNSVMEMVSFKTEYPLSAGDDDTITIEFDMDTSEGRIMINDAKLDFYVSWIEGAAIIDVDRSDAYKDVVVYDAGPSDDPTIIIYRYVDGTIYELGGFYGRYDYNAILFNGKGGVIEASDYIDFLEEQIVVQYQIISDNKAKEIDVDYSSALGKTYKLTYDMTVAFAETEDTDLENAYDYIDISNYLELKKGDEITLIAADKESSVYYVELSDGRKGVFTDHLAG